MANRTTGVINSLESLLLKNPNVNIHPRLAVFLTDYTGAIVGGYTPSQKVIDAILKLSPTAEAATSALDALINQLADRGLISLGLKIEQNTTLFGPLTGTNFADSIKVKTSKDFGIRVESSTFDLLGGNNSIAVSDAFVGISNDANSTFSLGNGNNIVTASNVVVGIENVTNSTFSLGDGNNTINASGRTYGVRNATNSTFSLGDGDNTINASGREAGIENFANSTFSLGGGDNTINASGRTYGVRNATNSTFSFGDGDNTINASGRTYGVRNATNSTFSFGDGDNTINASGLFAGISNWFDSTFSLGDGDNTINVWGRDVGLKNVANSTFSLGSGNNTINASSAILGIFNDGTIATGAGKDVIDALIGGFGGSGTLNLGAGDDILKGHGSGNFFGGDGTDTLIFAEGIYNIVEVGDSFSISLGNRTGIYNSFEQIGGVAGDLLTLQAGLLQVEAAGASYIN